MVNKYEIQADRLYKAIKGFADNDSALENFKSYVSIHGEEWFKLFCSDLGGLISELESFSKIE